MIAAGVVDGVAVLLVPVGLAVTSAVAAVRVAAAAVVFFFIVVVAGC